MPMMSIAETWAKKVHNPLHTSYTSQLTVFGRATEKVESLIGAILSPSTPFVVPEDPEVTRQMLVDLANHARTLDRQLSLARGTLVSEDTFHPNRPFPQTTSTTPSPNSEAEAEDSEDSLDTITTDFQKLLITHNQRHYGRSSDFVFLQYAFEAGRIPRMLQPLTGTVFASFRRPEFWHRLPFQRICDTPDPGYPLVFPDPDLLQDLIRIYFSTINCILPLLHRPTFERSVAAGLHFHDRPFAFTVLAVCAIASRQSDDPRNLYDGTDSCHSLGWKWFQQIPLVQLKFTDQPTLYDVQSCILTVLFLRMTSTPDSVWILTGVGIRYAQEMGAHRKKPKGHKRTIEDELWNRAFWILLVTDFSTSIAWGRPSIVSPDNYDADLPADCDDEYWEHSEFQQPEGTPSVISCFRTYCKLMEIAGSVQRTLYGIGKSPSSVPGSQAQTEAVLELDSALNQFVNDIPSHLKWDKPQSNFLFYWQSCILNSMVHWVRIRVHRPFILRAIHSSSSDSDTDNGIPSQTICRTAARSMVLIAEALHARRLSEGRKTSIEMAPSLISPLLIASLVFLVIRKEMEYVDRCMALVKWYEPRYQSAGRIVDSLNAIIAIVQNSDERVDQFPQVAQQPIPSENQVFPVPDQQQSTFDWSYLQPQPQSQPPLATQDTIWPASSFYGSNGDGHSQENWDSFMAMLDGQGMDLGFQ
ncbi:Gypsy retrotransposon integrase-like protein 1 [Paramarasmius palmivorus]|uniref:Gypsy retrotransposon integrase-like protein 1 n=1 Tax=Paramarasmius palmivorus TaxID=297713 RepID=A0AAW0B2G6_9AGAR